MTDRTGSDLTGRRVVVAGLGVSGFAAARALLANGARVFVTESGIGAAIVDRSAALVAAGAQVEIKGHDLDRIATYDPDLAVVSPGIPPSTAVIRALTDAGVELWSEVELAYRLATCDFLAVTGTNGKTTTTSLLAAILTEAGVPSVAAGNIGLPLVEAVAMIPGSGAIAVEVSSFQLFAIDAFRPRVAVLLNVAEDHTDWHGSFEAYAAAKARITENQKPDDVLIVNAADVIAMDIARRSVAHVIPFSTEQVVADGLGVDSGRLLYRGREFATTGDVSLPGAAGTEDALAAAGAALAYGVDERAVARAIQGFRPLPHRGVVVAEFSGVTYIDDSKATNPHAVLCAVRGLRDIVLIAGGRSKGIDLSILARTVPPVVAVAALGESASEVASVFDGLVPVDVCASMRDAVGAAAARCVAGGSVLLAPGCASLDMYEGYAARGEDFARCVKERITQERVGRHGDE